MKLIRTGLLEPEIPKYKLEVLITALPEKRDSFEEQNVILEKKEADSYLYGRPTPSHYQHFVIESPETFLVKILEGSSPILALVHIDPNGSFVIDQRINDGPLSPVDKEDIRNSFIFVIGPDYQHYLGNSNPHRRKPFMNVTRITPSRIPMQKER